jgi:hypothetical protein
VGAASKLCNNADAVSFVNAHRSDCTQIANQLKVPTENILGLAAQESQWGSGRIARDLNNFFSLHAPAPLQIGAESAQGDPKVKVAKFSSFLQCGLSFAARYGSAVRGISDPLEFSKKLVTVGFNTGNAASGGREGFAAYLADIIKTVKVRMGCTP